MSYYQVILKKGEIEKVYYLPTNWRKILGFSESDEDKSKSEEFLAKFLLHPKSECFQENMHGESYLKFRSCHLRNVKEGEEEELRKRGIHGNHYHEVNVLLANPKKLTENNSLRGFGIMLDLDAVSLNGLTIQIKQVVAEEDWGQKLDQAIKLEQEARSKEIKAEKEAEEKRIRAENEAQQQNEQKMEVPHSTPLRRANKGLDLTIPISVSRQAVTAVTDKLTLGFANRIRKIQANQVKLENAALNDEQNREASALAIDAMLLEKWKTQYISALQKAIDDHSTIPYPDDFWEVELTQATAEFSAELNHFAERQDALYFKIQREKFTAAQETSEFNFMQHRNEFKHLTAHLMQQEEEILNQFRTLSRLKVSSSSIRNQLGPELFALCMEMVPSRAEIRLNNWVNRYNAAIIQIKMRNGSPDELESLPLFQTLRKELEVLQEKIDLITSIMTVNVNEAVAQSSVNAKDTQIDVAGPKLLSQEEIEGEIKPISQAEGDDAKATPRDELKGEVMSSVPDPVSSEPSPKVEELAPWREAPPTPPRPSDPLFDAQSKLLKSIQEAVMTHLSAWTQKMPGPGKSKISYKDPHTEAYHSCYIDSRMEGIYGILISNRPTQVKLMSIQAIAQSHTQNINKKRSFWGKLWMKSDDKGIRSLFELLQKIDPLYLNKQILCDQKLTLAELDQEVKDFKPPLPSKSKVFLHRFRPK